MPSAPKLPLYFWPCGALAYYSKHPQGLRQRLLDCSAKPMNLVGCVVVGSGGRQAGLGREETPSDVSLQLSVHTDLRAWKGHPQRHTPHPTSPHPPVSPPLQLVIC